MASNTRCASEWKKYAEAIKAKRKVPSSKTQRKFQGNFLTIQRLSADVSGRAQKYARIGPREFVPIDSSEEVTLDNIKSACEKYFAPRLTANLQCDVLAGERGSSFKTVDQIPDLKIIHIRFVGKASYEDIGDSDGSVDESGTAEESKKTPDIHSSIEDKKPSKMPRMSDSPIKYPLSLSVVDMIKLGKIGEVKSSSTIVKVHHFDLESKAWSQMPTTVEFQPYDGKEEPCGQGRFRKVYKVRSRHPEFQGKPWVIKKYLPNAKQDIDKMGLTLKEHTMKTVQMHNLAKNFASQLEKLSNQQEEFGKPLRYRQLFFGEVTGSEEEYVTIENYIDGEFVKYINNSGIPCGNPSDVNEQKAQCLTHFSYMKSEKMLMLLDVQGSGENLYDPEIASRNLLDEKK